MLPKQWIDDFLQQRNLSYEDIIEQAPPLYQYRVTSAEFESLQESLKQAKDFAILLGLQNEEIKHWDVALVMYAAEWWRREYAGGSWQWENIFVFFDSDIEKFDTSQRHLIVERGLGFWQRKPHKIDGKIRYLDSIAIEGGLPLKQLINSKLNGDWLVKIFKHVISLLIHVQVSKTTNTFETVQQHDNYLPVAYRSEKVYAILAEMIDTVIALKNTHQLEQQENPVIWLDDNISRWREQFPLPLDDNVSSMLLFEMVKAATNTEHLQVIDNKQTLSIQIKNLIYPPDKTLNFSNLHSAVKIEPPLLRQLLIKRIFVQMRFDFEHDGWNYLNHLWKEPLQFSLNGFDIWGLIADDKKILAALVICMEQDFIQNLNNEYLILWELISVAEWFTVFQHYQLYLQKTIDNDSDIKAMIEAKIQHFDYLPPSMEIISRLLKVSLCQDLDADLSFMKTDNALNIFVIPQLNEAQYTLNNRQLNEQWPTILNDELIIQWRQLEKLQSLLELSEGLDEHYPVLTLPVLLAHFCLNKPPKYWLTDSLYIFKLKQLKAFDEEWFNTAFQLSLAYLSQLPECHTQLIEDVNNMISINDEEILELDQEIEQQIKDLEVQTDELKENTDALETEIGQSADLSDELILLKVENEELQERLKTMEATHEEFVGAFKEVMHKRDKALKYLLEEVTELNTKVKNIRGLLEKKSD